jgi:hypothetical protein
VRNGAVYNDAFMICHEIYQAARELVNSRVPTTQLTSASKFLWRPDLHPRLVEYVADFARCGDRALGDRNHVRSAPHLWGSRAPQRPATAGACGAEESRTPEGPLRAKVYQQDELSRVKKVHGAFGAKKFPRASRLILFRVYYLGGAEYEAARHLLGLSERTWSDWAEEVRARVGSELIRAGMYPPARYFRQASARPIAQSIVRAASTKSAPEAKMTAVPREPDFD